MCANPVKINVQMVFNLNFKEFFTVSSYNWKIKNIFKKLLKDKKLLLLKLCVFKLHVKN